MALTHSLSSTTFDAPSPKVVLLFQRSSTGLGLSQQLSEDQMTLPQQRNPILVASLLHILQNELVLLVRRAGDFI